jgi:hypothetical protein
MTNSSMTPLSPLSLSIRENDAMGTRRYLSFEAFSRDKRPPPSPNKRGVSRLKGKVHLASNGLKQEECVAPGGVDLWPIDLRARSSAMRRHDMGKNWTQVSSCANTHWDIGETTQTQAVDGGKSAIVPDAESIV